MTKAELAEALAEADAERDALAARVAELEAALEGGAAVQHHDHGGECELLKVKIETLEKQLADARAGVGGKTNPTHLVRLNRDHQVGDARRGKDFLLAAIETSEGATVNFVVDAVKNALARVCEA